MTKTSLKRFWKKETSSVETFKISRKSIEEYLEYTINHYIITYDDLQKIEYESDNDLFWSFFDKEGPEKAIDDLLNLDNF